jgi:hypothetical protein
MILAGLPPSVPIVIDGHIMQTTPSSSTIASPSLSEIGASMRSGHVIESFISEGRTGKGSRYSIRAGEDFSITLGSR